MSYQEPEPHALDEERSGDRTKGNYGITDHDMGPGHMVWFEGQDVGRVEHRQDRRWSAIVYDKYAGLYRRVSMQCLTRAYAEQAVLAAYRRCEQAFLAQARRLGRACRLIENS